ncbi:MAG: FUSC family protein [Euryarchaeota archaeon]|nr:FUSC family protein [Euryarchaeota archaeon]MDE1835994.1 FUSC family protein [Euryarchaeota archaeon]MDE2046014.1 FUSC family protein [Thermoplasmata archaeon]
MEEPIPPGPLQTLSRLRVQAFAPRTGLRVAPVLVAPLVIGWLAHDLLLGAVATLGAYFLSLIENPAPEETPSVKLFLAAFLNAGAYTFGSFAASFRALSIVLTAAGILLLTLISACPELYRVSFVGSFSFVVGVGLGPVSWAAPFLRGELMLAGGLLAAVVAFFAQRVARNERAGRGFRFSGGVPEPQQVPLLAGGSLDGYVVRRALIIAIMAAVGLAIDLSFDLTRGFWVLVTLVAALNDKGVSVVTDVLERVVGTIGGAVIGFAVIANVGDPGELLPLLFVFCAALFALRYVNLALMMVFSTPYLLVVQNILYPGSPQLALARVQDVLIGGGLAILGGVLLYLGARAEIPRRESPDDLLAG